MAKQSLPVSSMPPESHGVSARGVGGCQGTHYQERSLKDSKLPPTQFAPTDSDPIPRRQCMAGVE